MPTPPSRSPDRLARGLLAGIAVISLVLLGQPARTTRPVDTADPIRYLSGAVDGFARAATPRAFAFPADHAAHRAYRSEWWYFTGHLDDDKARRFGFQLTLFRFELAPHVADSPSPWRTPRLMLGHFAVSDHASGRFLHDERLTRAHPALAGVQDTPLKIWIDDWSISRTPGPTGHWRLQAQTREAALDLRLDASSPIVLQGAQGLSRKGDTAGNASYYYSLPRLVAHGQLRLDGTAHAVHGSAWLDREWGTSALERSQRGWDWFALQLDDGANLMFYRLRGADGATDPHSAGSLQRADGTVAALTADDVELAVSAWWRSPSSGVRYPARWRISVPRFDLELELVPCQADQEWRGRFRYWEGAVDVSGDRGGRGYVELTGY